MRFIYIVLFLIAKLSLYSQEYRLPFTVDSLTQVNINSDKYAGSLFSDKSTGKSYVLNSSWDNSSALNTVSFSETGLINDLFHISSLSDLPDVSGGVITITQSGVYLFEDTIDFGTNRIELAQGVNVAFISTAFYQVALTFSGDNTTHIKGLGQNIFINETITLVSTGDNDTLINLIDGQAEAIRSDLISTGTGSLAIKTTGLDSLNPKALYIIPELIAGFEKAIETDGFVLADITSVILIQDTAALDVPLVDIGDIVQMEMFKVNATTTNNGCVVKIDSSNTGKVTLRDIGNTGTGNFFCTSSATQDSPYINVINCGDEFDSKNYVFMNWNTGTATTAITDGVYTDLNLNGINDTVKSRFTITDPAKGEFTYTGLNNVRLKVELNIAVDAAPPTERVYRFALNVNDETLVYATEPYSHLHLRSTGNQTRFDYVVEFSPGDKIRPQAAGEGTGDDIDITSGQIVIRTF